MRPLLISCVLSLQIVAPAMWAATIVVDPGPGTPIQDAIDAASPGDTVRLTNGGLGGPGFFFETVRVTKRLRLLGLGTGGTIIDAGCTDPIALEVAADDVIIRGLTVQGGTQTAIDITGRTNVRVSNVDVNEEDDHCGTAAYGFNIVASSRVKLSGSRAIGPYDTGFQQAGWRLSGIIDGGNVFLKRAISAGNVRGIVVEDSGDAPGGSPGIRVSRAIVDHNPSGILLIDSDGVRIDHSEVHHDLLVPAEPGSVGIHLDATSDENVVRSSFVNGFETDVRDDGAGNCWLRNVFSTGSVGCN